MSLCGRLQLELGNWLSAQYNTFPGRKTFDKVGDTNIAKSRMPHTQPYDSISQSFIFSFSSSSDAKETLAANYNP